MKLLLEFDTKENFKQKCNSLKNNLYYNPTGWFWRIIKTEPYDYIKYQNKTLNMEQWARENLNYRDNNKNLYISEYIFGVSAV